MSKNRYSQTVRKILLKQLNSTTELLYVYVIAISFVEKVYLFFFFWFSLDLFALLMLVLLFCVHRILFHKCSHTLLRLEKALWVIWCGSLVNAKKSAHTHIYTYKTPTASIHFCGHTSLSVNLFFWWVWMAKWVQKNELVMNHKIWNAHLKWGSKLVPHGSKLLLIGWINNFDYTHVFKQKKII